MRVSVSKQKPAPQGVSAAARGFEKSTFASTSGIGSVLHLQRTVRNRAVIQRQPPPQGQGGSSSGMDPKFWEWWKAVQGFEGSLAD